MRGPEISIRLERTPESGRRRYYQISLTRDLFGAPVLLRFWGGVGGARGGARRETHVSQVAARIAASQWLRKKRRRGYRKSPA